MEEEQYNRQAEENDEQGNQMNLAPSSTEEDQSDPSSMDALQIGTSISQENLPVTTTAPEFSPEITELKERLARRDTKIVQLEAEIRGFILEAEKHKNEIERFSELEQKNKVLSESHSALRQQTLEHESELSINQNELKLLQSRITQLQQDLEQNQQILDDFRVKVDSSQDLEEENLKLATDLEKLLEDKHVLQEKVTTITEDYDLIQNFLTQSKDDVLSVEKENEGLAQDKGQLNATISDLQEELELKKQECIKIREESVQVGENVDSATNSLNAQMIEKGVLIDDLRQELRGYKDKILSMVHKEELEKLQAEIDLKSKQIAAWEEKLSEKTQNLEHFRKTEEEEKSRLENKIEELQTQLVDMQQLKEILNDKEEVIKDFEKREEEFHEALMDGLRVQAEKEDLNDKITELITQKGVLFERINEIKNHDRGHLAIIQRLETKIAAFESEKQEQEPELSPEQKLRNSIENDLLKQRIEELNIEVRDQIVRASEAVGRYEVTKDQIDQLNHQVKEAKDKYDLIKQDIDRVERKAQEDREEFTQKVNQSEQDLKDALDKISTLESDMLGSKEGEEFKEQIALLKRDLEEQSGIAESLADDVSKSSIEMLMAKKENARLNEEILGLKRRIKLLRRDLSQK